MGRQHANNDTINSGNEEEMTEPVQVRQRKSCDDCGFKTTSVCVLKKHIELTHTDIKKKRKPSTRLHCDSCEKYFYKKEKLSEHRRTMHKEENLPINNNNYISTFDEFGSQNQRRKRNSTIIDKELMLETCLIAVV